MADELGRSDETGVEREGGSCSGAVSWLKEIG